MIWSNTNVYVKSFEEDFSLKTFIDWTKYVSQTLEEILSINKIIPNTISFWQNCRLSTTLLWKNHTLTYRPQGIVFTTDAENDYIYPFDLIVLTANDEFEVEYYRDPDLHNHYNRNLISWYEKFQCQNYDQMIQKFWNNNIILEEVNKFRVQNWFKEIPEEKKKLIQYNEAVFHEPIWIKIIWIFWNNINDYTKQIISHFWIKIYKDAKECFLDIQGNNAAHD